MMPGALFVQAAIAFQNQAYNPRCLTEPVKSCRQTLTSFAMTLLVFLLVAFSLGVTSKFPRLALGLGLGAGFRAVAAQGTPDFSRAERGVRPFVPPIGRAHV